jgi:hypothetical protein
MLGRIRQAIGSVLEIGDSKIAAFFSIDSEMQQF